MGGRFILTCMSATQTKSKKTRITEAIGSGYREIDRAAGTIRDVKILGLVSKNGRRYSSAAVAAAAPLYEGVKVYIDHQVQGAPKTRPTRERWGILRNVHVVESGELFGDLEYLKSHALTEQILEAVERWKDSGLSHDADGVMGSDGVVEQIRKVYSVDFVTDPATTRNLFEDVQPMKINILQAIREGIEKPFVARFLAKLTESDAMPAEEAEIEMSEGDSPLDSALRATLMGILDGEGTIEEKFSKLRSLLDGPTPSEGEASGDETSGETSGEMEEACKTQKSREAVERLTAERDRLQEQCTKLQAQVDAIAAVEAAKLLESSCTALLEAAGREVTPLRVKALGLLPEDQRDALVNEWPKAKQRPEASPSKFQESLQQANSAALPDKFEDFSKRLA